MALRFTDTTITSDILSCGVGAVLRDGLWWVTGYPGRAFDRNQAITAMVLAEVLTLAPACDDPIWRHVANWRRELGLPEAGDRPCR